MNGLYIGPAVELLCTSELFDDVGACVGETNVELVIGECAKLRGLRGSRGLEKLRGSWVVGRGTWVTLRGSWVKLRGSWVLFTDNFA